MRAALAIFALILAAVALAALTSHLRPHPDPTLAEESQQKTDDWQKTLDKIQKDKTPNTNDPKHFAAFDPYKTGALRAVLEIENRGVIEMELYPKAAPKTVAHFVDLCHKHFYNGIKFHRVEFDFVAQAGDPTSKDLDPSQFKLTGVGTHGSGQTVPLEAKLPNLGGTVGLARSEDLDSGDSQFYFNLKDNSNLDSRYCVFGRVTKGADILPKIEVGDRIVRLDVP